LRRTALAMIEQWWEAVQESSLGGEHPLASVQSLHLVAASESGPRRHHSRETRASGKSRPLVRDLPRGVREADEIMRDIGQIDRRYHTALCRLAEHRGLVSKVAESMQVTKPTAYRYVDVGLGMVQMGLLR